MSKSIQKMLLLALCSLPATGVMAAAPSLSECSSLQAPELIPSACKHVEDTQAVFKTYSPPQPFVKVELTEYQADQPAQSSSGLAPSGGDKGGVSDRGAQGGAIEQQGPETW
jgi:hypothetical protein